MRFNPKHLHRYVLVGGTLVALSCAPGIARAQSGSASQAGVQAQGQMQAQGSFRSSDWVAFEQFLDAHPDVAAALRANPDLIDDQDFLGQHSQFRDFCDSHPRVRHDADADRDRYHNWFAVRHEVAKMDQFLDTHQGIQQQLASNPALIQDQNYLQNHPELRDFLNNNPQVRGAFDRNPTQFMRVENWYENSTADRAQDATEPGTRRMQNPNPDLTRRQVRTMDQWLDNHPNIEKQLEANPSLVTNQNFLNANPQLRDFLNNSPNLRDEIAENPQYWAEREERYENSARDQRQDANNSGVDQGNSDDRGTNPNPDLTRRQVRTMDQWLDNHPNIEKQLEANPSLVTNQNFLNANPQLRDFLNNSPNLRDEIAENPQYWAEREARYENSAQDQRQDANTNNGDANRGRSPNRDLTQGEVASMDQFLDSHPDVEKQLQSNPSLINNGKYLNDHPQLRAFLDGNAQIREEFTENPSYFMQRENQFEAHENGSGQVATMDAYLDKHPNEAHELNAYPARINDSDYLSHHKDLEAFLKKHPEVREQFMSNPSAFMRQESSFDACAQLDDFLNAHKKVAKDLDRNPANVKDTAFLDHHKDLKHFFDKNPGVNDQFQTDPHGFWYREQHFEAERQMDAYFSTHRGVAKDLQKDPDRVKDASYLEHHKHLKELMSKNPQLEQAANTSPSAFMKEQMKFHEQYRNQHEQQKTKVQERAATHQP